jgi:hypothetical protein
VTETVESILREFVEGWQRTKFGQMHKWAERLLAAHARELEIARLEARLEEAREWWYRGIWADSIFPPARIAALERQIAERKAE